METAMLVTTFIHATRPSIMQARTERAVYVGKLLRIGAKRFARRLSAWRARIALALQYEHELAALLQADDRMLADIGMTRGEVIASARSRWFTPGRMAEAAAARRRDAMQIAKARHELPRVAAPALAPGAAACFLTVETSNFR
jgi:uncharacterized protein YjiS (DUF1127 family)